MYDLTVILRRLKVVYDPTVILRRLNCVRSDRNSADRDSPFFWFFFLFFLVFSLKLQSVRKLCTI